MRLLALLCTCPLALASDAGLEDNDEYKLRHHFYEMQALNPNVRPVKAWTDRVNVRIAMDFNGLTAVDEGTGTITNSAIMAIAWEDAFLTWDEDEFRLPYIYLGAGDMWLPDVEVYNSYHVENIGADVIQVFANGTCNWVRRLVLTTKCAFDLKNFPFDVQQCGVYLGPTQLYDNQQKLSYSVMQSSSLPKFDMMSFARLPIEGDCVEAEEGQVQKYNCLNVTTFKNTLPIVGDVEYTTGKYTVVLGRYTQFYESNGVLPVILVTGIVYLSFFLPTNMVERMDFGATALLAIVAVMFVIADKLPTQENMTMMDRFFGLSLIFNLIALAESCIVVTFATNTAFKGLKASVGFFLNPKMLDKIMRFVFPVIYVVMLNDMLLIALQNAAAAAGY